MSITVYKASAGSGKTFTLVKEYLKLCLLANKPNYYQHILAITFTNKAANEMKERVISWLKQLTSEELPVGSIRFLVDAIQKETGLDYGQIHERAKLILIHMLHHYSDVNISTIDSFVLKVIRSFAYDLGLPLTFEVELDQDSLIRKVTDELIENAGRDPILTQALVEFSEHKADEDAAWQIEEDLTSFAKMLGAEKHEPILKSLRNYSIEDFRIIKQDITVYKLQADKYLYTLGKEALELIEQAGGSVIFSGGTRGIAKYFEYICSLQYEKFEPTTSHFKVIESGKWHASKASTIEQQNVIAVSGKLNEIFDKIQKWIKTDYQKYVLVRLAERKLFATALINEIEKEISTYKQTNQVLPITEFNKIVANVVLHEPVPFIFDRIGEKYKHYLIDEFQDTSVVQFQNMLPLLENSLAYSNFNMLVGDGKQSIYRWRGGEVEQFVQLPTLYNPEGHKMIQARQSIIERSFEEKVLDTNYRSKREIIEFNNMIFRSVSSSLNDAQQTIYNELEQKFDPNNSGGLVHLKFETDKTEYEANILEDLLQTIYNLKQDGFFFQDIAIITRNNIKGTEIANFLLENDIPIVSNESLLLKESPYVKVIVTYLEWLISPEEPYKQIAFLLALYEANILEVELDKELSKSFTEHTWKKWLKAKGLAELLEYDKHLSLYEMCENMLRITGMQTKLNAYLIKFLESVHSFERKKGNSLKEFLRWWDMKKDRLSIALPEHADAIKIMTVHKSKGLEFPVVLYPFANSSTTPKADNIWLNVEHEELKTIPAAVVSLTKKLELTHYNSIYDQEVQKYLLDELNVYYVAFTRPEQRLYCWMHLSKKSGTFGHLFKNVLEHCDEWDPNTLSYHYGMGQSPDHEQQHTNEKKLAGTKTSNWSKQVGLSLKAPEVWNTETPQTEHQFGNLVHYILSKLVDKNSIDEALKNAINIGILEEDQEASFRVLLQNLLDNPKFAQFFELGLTVKIEEDIITPAGTYRPDRVIQYPHKYQVVDFKTGKETRTHHKQIIQYGKLLLEMGISHIELYLIYTEKNRVERIMF